jgi:hypothetical protein
MKNPTATLLTILLISTTALARPRVTFQKQEVSLASALDIDFPTLRWASLSATSHVDAGEFVSVHQALDDYLVSAYLAFKRGENALALSKLSIYDAHVQRLVKSGRITPADGERIASMSAKVRADMAA